MYSLAIVDDEELTRRGLSEFTDWASMGFEATASFEDGKEAIQHLSEHPTDVVLTDIKMAEVSGIEVAEYVFRSGLPTKIVILSGYREFEDAQKAIEYGVQHYLLKPVNIAELHATFDKLRTQLDAERAKDASRALDIEFHARAARVFKEHFLLEVLLGLRRNRVEIVEQFPSAALQADPVSTPCFMAEFSCHGLESVDLKELEDAVRRTLHRCATEVLPICVRPDPERLVAICFLRRGATVAALGSDAFRSHFIEVLPEPITLKSVEMYSSFIDLARSVAPFGSGAEEIGSDSRLTFPIERQAMRRMQRDVMTSLFSRDNDRLEQSLIDAFHAIASLSVEQARNVVIELFAGLRYKIEASGISYEEVEGSFLDYSTIAQAPSIALIQRWTEETLYELFRHLEERMGNVRASTIERAKRYILENYPEDLTLREVAGQVFLSPMYFSHVFKEESGENFIDFLIRTRMEKAAELLREEGRSISEVGESVGYRDRKYFSKRFKRHFGVNPSEFRHTITHGS